MKVLIPAAGLGTRLRPHTHHRPKPLIPVAGKTVLGHMLDRLSVLDVEEIIFIVGHLGEQIESYVAAHYAYPTTYVVQRELLGQAHAVGLAREHISGPLLILFVDTVFEADLAGLPSMESDGAIFYKSVSDPRRFGIITADADGVITEFVEKPEVPKSNRAVIGLYYLRQGEALVGAIDELIERDIQSHGEFYLADALQLMIDRGARLEAWPVDVWEDCGTVPAVLQANRYLLEKLDGISARSVGDDVVLIPPVTVAAGAVVRESVIGPFAHIGPGCTVERSVVGPYVSLAAGAAIDHSLVRDAIVDENARIEEATLGSSLVGESALVRGRFDRFNVGDSSEIDSSGSKGGELLGAPDALESDG